MPAFDPDPRLRKDRAALVLFDVLQAYLHPSDPARAAALEGARTAANLQRLLEAARAAGLAVFFARANHSPDRADLVQRLTDTDMDLHPWPDPAHPRSTGGVTRDQPGAQIATELAPLAGEALMVFKHRWSAFFQTSLELGLRTRGLDTIVLAGLSTDVGIASTAYAARDLDFGIVVVRDACYAHRGPNHDFLMDRIFPRMGRVMSTEQAVSLMA
jgi:ureidoacrylate peracid hydrolase